MALITLKWSLTPVFILMVLQQTKLAYIPGARKFVVEYDLPSFEIVPEVGAYKYVKAKDSVTEIPLFEPTPFSWSIRTQE